MVRSRKLVSWVGLDTHIGLARREAEHAEVAFEVAYPQLLPMRHQLLLVSSFLIVEMLLACPKRTQPLANHRISKLSWG